MVAFYEQLSVIYPKYEQQYLNNKLQNVCLFYAKVVMPLFLKIYIFYIYILLYNNRRKLLTVKGPFMGRQVTIVSNHVNNLHKSTK